MTDRYTKTVLTIIAGALVYLCIVMTAFPVTHAQGRAGEIATPGQMVIVGWKADPLPVVAARPLPVAVPEPLRVTTERSTNVADRVIVVGWEARASRERGGVVQSLPGVNTGNPAPLPVVVTPQ
jgi:hypothetical protein